MLDQIIARASEFGQLAIDYLSRSEVYIQLGIVVALFLPAFLLSNRVEPWLEERARSIKGMPGLLRVVVAFLRRMEWLFFVILLGIAYVITSIVAWPDSNYIIYSAMLLAGAWLLVSVASHAIRSRLVGRFLGILVWIYVATSILGVADDVRVVLDSAAFTVGSHRISLLSVFKASLVVIVALWLSLTTGNLLDRRIQQVDELTPSLRVLLGKIARIALVAIAVTIVISETGIDLTFFTVLSGAVGVGIGFGLQKVVSNFISGIIILLDQSIKPGDTISVGDTFGWIRELRARFVSVVTRDGREFLIPNEDLITHQVINWSFSDKFVRLDVEFGVSYDSDPHEVARVAIEATAALERVASNRKPPVCWLTAFGDSSLDFKLRFWIADPQMGLTNIRGKVMLALWDAFKENGIGIPYPHREVIVKTPIPVE